MALRVRRDLLRAGQCETDFWPIIQFLRIAAWAHDGAIARATAEACRHRRHPRGFDVPGFVYTAIGLGELCQRHLERHCARMAPCSWLLKKDGTIEPIIGG